MLTDFEAKLYRPNMLATHDLFLLDCTIVEVIASTQPRPVLFTGYIIHAVSVLRSDLVASLIHSLNLVWFLRYHSTFFFTGENGCLHLFHGYDTVVVSLI